MTEVGSGNVADALADRPVKSRSVAVTRENALTLNSLGSIGESWPFPISYSAATSGGIVAISLLPFRLQDLLAIPEVEWSGSPFVVASHRNDFVHDEDGRWNHEPDSVLFQRVGIRPIAIDGGAWLLEARDLQVIVSETNHYEFIVVDVPLALGRDLAEVWLTAETTNWVGGKLVLANLPGSNLFIDVHDDCYVYIESTNDNLAFHLAAYLLAHAVGVSLLSSINATSIEIPLPDTEIIDFMLGAQGEFSLDQAGIVVKQGIASIPFSGSRWTLRDSLPVATAVVTLDTLSGAWTKSESLSD